MAAKEFDRNLSLELNIELDNLSTAIERFADEFHRDLGDVLPQQAKLLARDLQKLTPPFQSLNPKESFSIQRKVGQNAVARDINTVFADIRTLGIFTDPKNPKAHDHALALLNGGRNEELLEFLKECGYGYRVRNVVSEPTDAMHNAERNGRGRIHEEKRTRYWVTKSGAIGRYIKTVQKRVGKLKAGWNAAARKYGANAPQWIAGQAGPGSVVDKAKAFLNPFIKLINAVSYAGQNDNDVRFAAKAVEFRGNALKRQVEAKLDGRIKKFNRG